MGSSHERLWGRHVCQRAEAERLATKHLASAQAVCGHDVRQRVVDTAGGKPQRECLFCVDGAGAREGKRPCKAAAPRAIEPAVAAREPSYEACGKAAEGKR